MRLVHRVSHALVCGLHTTGKSAATYRSQNHKVFLMDTLTSHPQQKPPCANEARSGEGSLRHGLKHISLQADSRSGVAPTPCETQTALSDQPSTHPAQPVTTTNPDIWIFGYGSLIYRPGFEFSNRVVGFIRGFKRVFYQGSTDHRGTPTAPGRTVTLEPCNSSVTWGVAYRLTGDRQKQEKTLAYLEWREKQYDVRTYVDILSPGGSGQSDRVLVSQALVYIASPDSSRNINYLGPAPLAVIAKQIATASGPSGPNYEYLYKLAEAVREMEVHEAELFELEHLVRKIRGEVAPAVCSTEPAVTVQTPLTPPTALATVEQGLVHHQNGQVADSDNLLTE